MSGQVHIHLIEDVPATGPHSVSATNAAKTQLQRFCEGVLRLLKLENANEGLLALIVPPLLRALDEGSRETASQLRNEIHAWDAATAQLQQLASSSFLPFGDEIQTLLVKLERVRSQAADVADILESLKCPPPQFESDAPVPAASVAMAEPFTQALQLDPRLGAAYLHRGRIRLRKNQTDLAIEDFTNALRLTGEDPFTYGSRGDAQAICGRLSEAIDDYDRALQLRSDLFLIRYNRAVVLRKIGQLDRSLEEFDQLIRLKPKYAPLYLNRGLIFLERERLPRALTEFKMALRYQPNCQEAQSRLQETATLLKRQGSTKATGPQPSPIHRPHIPSAAHLAPSANSASMEKPLASPSASFDSAHAATISEEAATDCNLPCDCPACGKRSYIRWDHLQLGYVMACRYCGRKFSSDKKGNLFEAEKNANGNWVNLKAKQERQQLGRARRNQWIMGFAGLILFTLSMYSVPKIASTFVAVEPQLPRKLEPRAEIFASAWLNRDYFLMRRLTDPAQDRLLFVWYKRNPPPSWYKPEENAKDVQLDVDVVQNEPQQASLRVRFDGLRKGAGGAKVDLNLAWHERGGTWVFQPDPNLRIPTSL